METDLKTWDLRLFVMDKEPRSEAAIKNLKRVFGQFPKHKFHMKVIDLKVHPEMARAEQIFAVPTLQKLTPKPQKLLVGDFSVVANVLKGLGVEKAN